MDDVARALAVSKKTLYQYFTNKDELVTEVVVLHMEGEKQEFSEIINVSSNAIEELYRLSKCMRKHIFKINPALLFDLQKYHTEAWGVFQAYKHEFIQGQIKHNLERGIKEGYYRAELNAEVLSILRMETIQLLFSEQLFPRSKFEFVEVQMQVFDHFVHGILSEKGRQLYQQHQILEDKLQSK